MPERFVYLRLKRTVPPDNGGCDFGADPAERADKVAVFWHPAVDPGVVVLSALPPAVPSSSLARFLDGTSQRIAADGRHWVRPRFPHQFWLPAGPIGDGPHGAMIPLDELLPQRLANTLAVWWHLQDGQSYPRRPISAQRQSRLVLGLRALDGAARGHSHRAIARGLFGSNRVPTGPAWKSHHLRSRTIRLLTDARAFRDGSYLALLRVGPTLRL